MAATQKLERLGAPTPPSPAQPLTLAEQIEKLGRALTAEQLATYLAVSRIIIYKLAKAGRIPSFRIGTCVRFDPKSVANWLRRQ